MCKFLVTRQLYSHIPGPLAYPQTPAEVFPPSPAMEATRPELTPRPPPVPIREQMPCTDVPVCLLGLGWPWSPHLERKDQAHGGPGRGQAGSRGPQAPQCMPLCVSTEGVQVCACVCKCVSVCVSVWGGACMVCLFSMCVCACMSVCVSIWGDAHVGYVCLCVHASACTYVFLYMCSCAPLYVYMFVSVYVCLCVSVQGGAHVGGGVCSVCVWGSMSHSPQDHLSNI